MLRICTKYFLLNKSKAGSQFWTQYSESRRDEEEGGELDSHEEVRHFAGPGEIRRRDVVLDSQVSPEEIKSREVELGLKGGLFFASVVSQQRSYGHCPGDCFAPQLRQQLRRTLVAVQWRNGH